MQPSLGRGLAAQHLHACGPNQRNRPAAHVRALRSRVRPTRALARPSPPALSLAWPSSTAAQPIWVRASLAVGSASDGRPSSSREQNPPARGPTAAPSTTAAVKGGRRRRRPPSPPRARHCLVVQRERGGGLSLYDNTVLLPPQLSHSVLRTKSNAYLYVCQDQVSYI